ncbi:MAG: helix-hairpin-helix domain-containing protein [Bacteroidales bacterium]|nr:helix-hairpin-helix domain-containing protein [Bacteroidales bacterium]
MKIDFKKYFSFKKKDRIGIISLSVLILIIISLDLFLPKLLNSAKNEYDFTEFSAEIDTFMLSLVEVDDNAYISRLDSFIIAKYDSLELFMFDPNYTSDAEWLLLGLTQKQITTLNNYKDRGGKFKIKDDFRKIYGIRTMQFKLLEQYIDLPESLPNTSQQGRSNNQTTTNDYVLFEFDPNTATDNDFKKLGLSDRQITTINNYKNKGGYFKIKEDFKKIYVISEDDYNRLAPFIVIKNQQTQQNQQPAIVDIPTIEINSADTSLFKQLPGIGAVLSERIIKFRTKLGGFYSVEQIKEVYGITPETYNQIKQYLTINTNNIAKININFAEYSDLVKHPYIDSNTANAILNYKKQHGFYNSVEQLLSENVLELNLYNKLSVYLTVK